MFLDRLVEILFITFPFQLNLNSWYTLDACIWTEDAKTFTDSTNNRNFSILFL